MTNPGLDVLGRLRAAREKQDPIGVARRQSCPDADRVLEVLTLLRGLCLDQTPSERLAADLDHARGLVAGMIGPEPAERLVNQLPEVRDALALDIEAAYEGDPSANAYAEIVAAYPSIRAVSSYRVAHLFYKAGHPVIARIMAEHAHGATGIDISPGAEIGTHFFIDHGTGVVIGETTIIGNRVKLYHGVTLGAFSNKAGRLDVNKKRHPTIEDEVTIYPNATILGGETVVGRGSVIGGNAWLTRSVDPYTKVLIEPPRLLLHAPERYEI